MLELQNICKQYKTKNKKDKTTLITGIKNISFKAYYGKIFGLIGANGAGKTTTMRIISDLIKPQEGIIRFNDTQYNEIKNIKRYVSFVSNETQIYDRLTPREIFEIFSTLGGNNKAKTEILISNLTERLNMKDYMDIVCENFSSGMKQKVSIARALVTEPEILVFDEITNGLDIFAAKAVKDILFDLKKLNKIIIFSTHIFSEVDELCDDIGLMDKGRIVEFGSLNSILKKYDSKNTEELFFKLIEKNESITNS